ncbi:MAG: stalk domain-containing protein [Candidatus Cohnella colombiensis]|uniref:Stalk domain-containing protein n=1 Tax=Candidatus Cohnella colombiensis TaxID=3121368 RepID=A0AA95EW12_9BACL|nr:MAG: stalk domain-containing protein [Cohnella sp.]
MVIKKSVFVSALIACSLIFGSIGVVASNGVEKIQAFLNHNITFKVNGQSWKPVDADGNKLSAVVIDGTTYLPLKATAKALDAKVAWDGKNQVVSITTSSSSNEGVPFKDAEDYSSSDSSSSSSSSSNSSSSNSSSSSTSTGVIKLSGTKSQMEEKMRAQAVVMIKAYGEDLKSGKTTKMSAYINANVAPKVTTSGPYRPGIDSILKRYAGKIAGNVAANDADTIKKYGDALLSVKLSEVETNSISDKSVYSQDFSYKFYPSEWNAFSSVYVYFTFSAEEYDSSNFILTDAYIS